MTAMTRRRDEQIAVADGPIPAGDGADAAATRSTDELVHLLGSSPGCGAIRYRSGGRRFGIVPPVPERFPGR